MKRANHANVSAHTHSEFCLPRIKMPLRLAASATGTAWAALLCQAALLALPADAAHPAGLVLDDASNCEVRPSTKVSCARACAVELFVSQKKESLTISLLIHDCDVDHQSIATPVAPACKRR